MGFGPSERGLVVWDLATGKEVRRLDVSLDWINGLAFSPDGRTLAIAGGDRNARLRTWDVTTGRAGLRIGKRPVAMDGAMFSPDGKYLVTGSQDTTALLWDVAGIRPPRHAPAELRREELQSLWSDLAGDDGAKVHRAVWALADDPVRSVPLLGERVRPVVAAD